MVLDQLGDQGHPGAIGVGVSARRIAAVLLLDPLQEQRMLRGDFGSRAAGHPVADPPRFQQRHAARRRRAGAPRPRRRCRRR
jgi:hypothetical protein